jgi:hypothetical protein
MKVKHVLGTITILVIIGGTIYAIKKSKDAQKQEEQAISLDEAKAIVKEKEVFDRQDERIMTSYSKADTEATRELWEAIGNAKVEMSPRFVGDKLESVSIVGVRRGDEPIEEDYEEVDDEDNQEAGLEVDYSDSVLENKKIQVNTSKNIAEEDKVLRFEPSSIEALNQFKRMELADWHHTDETYHIMARLFDFPFQPTCDGDDFLRTNIIDYRVQFFGFGSKWSREVSYADVILYYARAAFYNCDESVRFWVEYFLEFNEFPPHASSQELDEVLMALNKHTYFNEERATFGLFGLTRESMDNAFKIANRNIDCSVTYEIEFNEFLKSCL